MIEKIRKKLRQLTDSGDKIIVALSGGADSVCLAHAMYMLSGLCGFSVCCAHVNHHLRGEQSDRDALFVREFCKNLGVECFVMDADVRQYAKEKGISEELAGREIRYAFFTRLAQEHGYHKIATAHHKNDSAETILMHLMRGSSIAGLTGIPERRGNIIRPLLDLTRMQIEQYCAENGLEYVTDSTNTEMIYTRNKIRLELIPYIQQQFNPNFVETVTANGQIIADENAFLDAETDKALCQVTEGNRQDIVLERFLLLHPALRRRVLYRVLQCAGAKEAGSEEIAAVLALCQNGTTGKRITLAGGLCARVEYGRLIIGDFTEAAQTFSYPVMPGCRTEIPEAGIAVRLEKMEKAEKQCFFCPDDAVFEIRSRRNGDFFYPTGMHGKKKVKDYFIDCKIPREKRDRIPILTCGGEIMWIVGMRRDKRFLSGKHVYKVTIDAITKNMG